MKKLGSRIRRKREHLHLQLNDLAKKVGISSSALSQIENAKAFPSIVTLKAIADHLHSSVGELIGEKDSLSEKPLTKANEVKFVKENKSGTKLYLLSHLDPVKKMETYKVVFVNGSNADDIMSCHTGQEFIHLLSGVLEISQGDRIFNMQSGDSFFVDPSADYIITSVADDSVATWVVVPD
jgi:transcriptional regulator with XRE-family HTH domain